MEKFIASLPAAVSRSWAAMVAVTAARAIVAAPLNSPEPAQTRPGMVATPELHLSADLLGLLGVTPGSAQTRAVADDFRVRRSHETRGATTGLQDGLDLLEHRLSDARHWLEGAETRARLAERNIAVEEVTLVLEQQARSVRAFLAEQAQRRPVVFPLVPTAHYLFSTAVQAADHGLPEEDQPLAALDPLLPQRPPAPSRQGTGPVGTVAAPSISQEPGIDPHIDLVRREHAVKMLENFNARFAEILPQIAMRRLHPLWRFVQGDINFMRVEHAAAVFPCATAVTGGADGQPLEATYPTNPGTVSLRRPFVRDWPVVVERDPGTGMVRVSTDGRNWRQTSIYTDAVVEEAKLRVWEEVMATGDRVYRHAVEFGLWR